MAMNFCTVPVELARQKAGVDLEPTLPLIHVVDDEPLIVNTLIAILNARGLAAIPAFDGNEALELARLIPPDVLITDVAMPGIGGFALALEVAKAAPDCDIILLSGDLATVDLAAEYRAQGYDFVLLIKPVHPLDLLACVFELLSLRGWLVPDAIPPRNENPSDAIYSAFASLHMRRVKQTDGIHPDSGKPSTRGPEFRRR